MSEREPVHRAETRLHAIGYAFQGWWYAIRTQRNAWIHAAFSIAVFIMCAWLQISRIEWAIIILTVTIVWMGEFMNTALEAVVDLASPDFHPMAKVGKDVAAAAVLLGAIASVLIGLLIMGPPLWARVAPLLGLTPG